MYSIVILFRRITPISMPTTRTPLIGRLYFIYQSIGQIISFQMMPPLRSFDDLDGKERGQKKTDDLRTMTTLGPRTLQYFLQISLKSSGFFLLEKKYQETVFARIEYTKSKQVLAYTKVFRSV